jgi:K+ transporter
LYFLSRTRIEVTEAPGMARWRKRLFSAWRTRRSTPADEMSRLRERTVGIASQVTF